MTTILMIGKAAGRAWLKRRWAALLIGLLLAASGWFLTSDSPAVWPLRNTVQYHLLTWWWQQTGYPTPGEPGAVQGAIYDEAGQPIAGAWVLISRWDGTTYSGRSDGNGRYLLPAVPEGRYTPVAGAPDYESVTLGGLWGVTVRPNRVTQADATLPPARPRPAAPGRDLVLSDPVTLTCQRPLESSAARRRVTFDNEGRPNQLTLFYRPEGDPTSRLPVLLAIYPGPADTWECASIPLAEAGYAVVAIGPAYSFEPELAVDELQRLVDFIRAGGFPGIDGARLAVLGGSYSGLHVQRLLQRDQSFQAAILLGAPSDLFDMRRRLENGAFIPPFGLDQALIALGLPGQAPLRYWRYSGAYHVRGDFPPLALLHSRSDDIVPVQQTELLASHLALAGARHETHYFDGASHYLISEQDEDDPLLVYELTLDFLARHLK